MALTLPPPARLGGGMRGDLPEATQQALGKLLAACGLENDFAGGLPPSLQPIGWLC